MLQTSREYKIYYVHDNVQRCMMWLTGVNQQNFSRKKTQLDRRKNRINIKFTKF